jgi:hypothetical protein
MVTVADRAVRVTESRKKICPPFQLDETLCFYSPQDNVDALNHPRVRDWLRFVTNIYRPELDGVNERVLLLMPCTKTKPYVFSTEHKRINQSILAAGYRPTGDLVAAELIERLESEYSPQVLSLAPLRSRNGAILHRAVISEPLAFVPYEHMLTYVEKPSPATAYDDPGLFENRGNAVSPWRSDSTATAQSETRWRWGIGELRNYVIMHNVMAETLAQVLTRLQTHYTRRIAWVAPGLTHRSFVLGRLERAAHNVPSFRKVGDVRMPLVGANDHLPAELQIECLPTIAQCEDARKRLAKRLRRKLSAVSGIYSRGGGDATPLALPELLQSLVGAIPS